MTREQLEARGDTSLMDAITRTTGVTSMAHPGNSYGALSARGFTDSLSVIRLYDGVRQYGNVTPSLQVDPVVVCSATAPWPAGHSSSAAGARCWHAMRKAGGA